MINCVGIGVFNSRENIKISKGCIVELEEILREFKDMSLKLEENNYEVIVKN